MVYCWDKNKKIKTNGKKPMQNQQNEQKMCSCSRKRR